MLKILNSEEFCIIFSFVIGLGLMTFLMPLCKGDECIVKKAPSVEEIKGSTFKIGTKCYQFRSEILKCPATGVIEAFEEFKG